MTSPMLVPGGIYSTTVTYRLADGSAVTLLRRMIVWQVGVDTTQLDPASGAPLSTVLATWCATPDDPAPDVPTGDPWRCWLYTATWTAIASVYVTGTVTALVATYAGSVADMAAGYLAQIATVNAESYDAIRTGLLMLGSPVAYADQVAAETVQDQ